MSINKEWNTLSALISILRQVSQTWPKNFSLICFSKWCGLTAAVSYKAVWIIQCTFWKDKRLGESDNLSAGDKLGKWIRDEGNKSMLAHVSNPLPSTFLQRPFISVYRFTLLLFFLFFFLLFGTLKRNFFKFFPWCMSEHIEYRSWSQGQGFLVQKGLWGERWRDV